MVTHFSTTWISTDAVSCDDVSTLQEAWEHRRFHASRTLVHLLGILRLSQKAGDAHAALCSSISTQLLIGRARSLVIQISCSNAECTGVLHVSIFPSVI